MVAKRRNVGMSYSELADYEGCVDAIRVAALAIAKETRDYMRNGELVSDGQIYIGNIAGDVRKIQNCMSRINAFSKKYGKL